MKGFLAFLSSQRDVGLLILRIAGGGLIFWAGWLKMFGTGFSGAINMVDKTGFPLPELFGPIVLLLEFFGGAAILVGLITRYLGLLFVIEFIFALLLVKINLPYPAFRIDIMLIAFGVLMATHGAGSYSLDRMLKLEQ